MEGTISKQFLILFLTVSAINCCINLSNASRLIVSETCSAEFIKTSCSTAPYPTLCFASLAIHARLIQTSPKLLAHAALNVTLPAAKATSAVMVLLSKSLDMKQREKEAMQDCLELLSSSVDNLRRSIGEMGQIKSSNFQLIMGDIQTWLSAASTDYDTCSDGFDKKTKIGKIVEATILNVVHLTYNALHLICNYASLNG